MITFKMPEYNEIPNVGLFLEQVHRYISEYLEPLVGITITPSMISNYVKQSIVSKPVKKQYYREQIGEIFFVALTKSVMSLENIQVALEMQKKEKSPIELYEEFKKEITAEIYNVFGDEYDEKEKGRTIIHNIAVAIAHKVYLEYTFENMKNKL